MYRTTTFRLTPLRAAAIAATTSLLAACGGGDDDITPAPIPAPMPVAVGDTVVLTASGALLSFNRDAPATQVGRVAVSGLATGETLVGIDVRPADGQLYALSSAAAIYVVDPSTGVATKKSTLAAATDDTTDPYTALTGDAFGIDFNPVADRLRVIGSAGQSLRINVDTGATTTDGAINLATGAATVTAAAYTNAFAGTTTTQLFDLDLTSGNLHLQDPPNNGTLAAGVALGVTATATNGFDIDARNNAGYAALTVGGETALYRINLAATAAAPAATKVGVIAGGEAIVGLALAAVPAPTALGLTADNRLVAFDPKAPNTLTATTTITGLGSGETVIGIDTRPADGQLYALTTAGKLYTVVPATGVATLKSTLMADAADTSAPFTGLASTTASVDFNPAADRLRVIASTGQSLRINVDTGATTTDGDINRASGAASSVLAAAYANSFAGTTATTLFDIDAASDVLAQQAPPNNGTLVDVGPIGIDVDGSAGFDIAGGGNGLALAALRGAGGSGPFLLYSVALTNGAATLYRNTGDAALSQIGGASGPALIDLALRF